MSIFLPDSSRTGLKIIGNDASVHRISTCGSQSQTLQRDSSTSPNSDSMFSRVLSLTYCSPRETPKGSNELCTGRTTDRRYRSILLHQPLSFIGPIQSSLAQGGGPIGDGGKGAVKKHRNQIPTNACLPGKKRKPPPPKPTDMLSLLPAATVQPVHYATGVTSGRDLGHKRARRGQLEGLKIDVSMPLENGRTWVNAHLTPSSSGRRSVRPWKTPGAQTRVSWTPPSTEVRESLHLANLLGLLRRSPRRGGRPLVSRRRLRPARNFHHHCRALLLLPLPLRLPLPIPVLPILLACFLDDPHNTHSRALGRGGIDRSLAVSEPRGKVDLRPRGGPRGASPRDNGCRCRCRLSRPLLLPLLICVGVGFGFSFGFGGSLALLQGEGLVQGHAWKFGRQLAGLPLRDHQRVAWKQDDRIVGSESAVLAADGCWALLERRRGVDQTVVASLTNIRTAVSPASLWVVRAGCREIEPLEPPGRGVVDKRVLVVAGGQESGLLVVGLGVGEVDVVGPLPLGAGRRRGERRRGGGGGRSQ
ncbi:hypothetical protein M432DRAFT_376385 [Thermoascus aurantiacus ATCC 26904]